MTLKTQPNMGTRFKTGYLADRVSFSEMGAKAGAEIAASLDLIQQRRQQRQVELDTRLGLTKAQQASLPSGLSTRYAKTGQLLLDDMQEKAALAFATGTPNAVSAYTNAKREYIDLINIATPVSSTEKTVMDNVAIGNFDNAVGTIPEIQSEYAVHDSGEPVIMDDGRIGFKKGDQAPVYWRDSVLNDTRAAFVPSIKFEGSDYLVAPLADSMYSDFFANSQGLYQSRFEGTDFQTGELNLDKLYEDVAGMLDKKNIAHPSEMGEAISIHGYKINLAPNKTELSQQDVLDARKIYPPEAYGPDATFLQGKFNEDGEYVFTVDIEPFFQSPNMKEDDVKLIRAAREAKKSYYEGIAGIIADRIGRDDESGKYAAALEAEAMAIAEAQAEAVAENAEAQAEYYAQTPALTASTPGTGDTQYMMEVGADSRYQMTIEGRGMAIEQIIFSPTGEEIAYRVSATRTRNENLQALIDSGEDPAAAQEIIDNWFAKYDNRYIALSGQGAEDTTTFLKIKTGLNNGIYESGNKPSSQNQRLLAREKIIRHQAGTLQEGMLGLVGMGSVVSATTTTTAATDAEDAETPPTTTTTAATEPAPEPAPEPVNLDVPPTAEEIELDNAVARAASAFSALGVEGIEDNVIEGIQNGRQDARMNEEILAGRVPIRIRFSPADYVSPEELEAMKGRLSDNLERSLITYLPIDELERMNPGDFMMWKETFVKLEVEKLKRATPDRPAPEQPTEDAPPAPADIDSIIVPEPSRPATEPEATVENADAYNNFLMTLDYVAQFAGDDEYDLIQDYYETLSEEDQASFEVRVSEMATRRMFPLFRMNKIIFVKGEELGDGREDEPRTANE